MGRSAAKALTNEFVAAVSKPGLYADGKNNLCLQVSRNGCKSWIFRFMLAGKTRKMGLGSLIHVSLEQARILAMWAKLRLQDGHDPIEERHQRRAVNAAVVAERRAYRKRVAAK